MAAKGASCATRSRPRRASSSRASRVDSTSTIVGRGPSASRKLISGDSRSRVSIRSVAPSTLRGRATTRCSTGVGIPFTTRSTATSRSTRLTSRGGGGNSGGAGRKAARKLQRPPVRLALQPEGDLLDLLVFQQPAHQFRPRILPALLLRPARQQHLRLESHEAARHVEIVGGLVEAEFVNHAQELVGDPRDRNVGDLDLLLPQQVQQQVERTVEPVELHHEARGSAQGDGGRARRHPKIRRPSPTANGAMMRWTWVRMKNAGARNHTSTGRRNATRTRTRINPNRCSSRYFAPQAGGRR